MKLFDPKRIVIIFGVLVFLVVGVTYSYLEDDSSRSVFASAFESYEGTIVIGMHKDALEAFFRRNKFLFQFDSRIIASRSAPPVQWVSDGDIGLYVAFLPNVPQARGIRSLYTPIRSVQIKVLIGADNRVSGTNFTNFDK